MKRDFVVCLLLFIYDFLKIAMPRSKAFLRVNYGKFEPCARRITNWTR